MNITIRTLTCAAACAALFPAFAQDDAETVEAAAEESADGVKAEKHISEIDQRQFTVLPFCKLLEGRADVLLPDAENWTPVEEGKFFPLGSRFRTVSPDARFELSFGREAVVSVSGLAAFGTLRQGLEVKSRTISLEAGTVNVRLPLNFPEKLFAVTAPGFSVESPAGVSRYVYRKTGDGDVAVVRCVSGVLSVKGRHFAIPAMHAANELEIRTSQDVLFTGLFGKSGDIGCVLDNGLVEETDWDAQKNVVVAKSLDWKLSPKTAVRIYRKVPEVGKGLSVSVMTFDSNGELKNRCTFAEGRHELNTGDQGPATKKDRERAAKALEEAAAAVETAEADPSAEAKSEQE